MLEQDEEIIANQVLIDLKERFVTGQDLPKGISGETPGLRFTDNWDYHAGNLTDIVSGDCEEFAMAARDALAHEGINSRLVQVINWNGDGHLITVTEHGYVLDNLLHHVAYIQDLSYHFVKQSGFLGDLVWHLIVN